MCRRAFGTNLQPVKAREIPTGTFNATYQVEFEDNPPVILRVAPPPASVGWDEVDLMRREHQILPFFAAIAALMPKIILADFTHQLIDRDYMFQTLMAGELWEDVAGELTPEEEMPLWYEFGSILKTIHTTRGVKFGWPYPGKSFSTWSETLTYRFETIGQELAKKGLDVPDFTTVSNLVRSHLPLLDEIQQPYLLHGDLWSFNILISRMAEEPRIVAVLDADRAWWGDPLADWTMFIWARGDGAEMPRQQAAFWQAYGQPEMSFGARFRAMAYEAMHLGAILLWVHQQGHNHLIQRGLNELHEVIELLIALIDG